MADVKLFQTDDDGDIDVSGGVVAMDGGLGTAAYLSLFGGNEEDDGRPLNPFTWWGNIGAVDQIRSETQNLLSTIPATSGNLRRVEDAARRDLAWMLEAGAATSVTVSASMPAKNRIKISITLNGDATLEFAENWRAT